MKMKLVCFGNDGCVFNVYVEGLLLFITLLINV